MVLDAPPEALDLLDKALQLNPQLRSTAEDLLEHQYLGALRCIEDEPATLPLNISEFEFEHSDLDAKMLREEIAIEVQH